MRKKLRRRKEEMKVKFIFYDIAALAITEGRLIICYMVRCFMFDEAFVITLKSKISRRNLYDLFLLSEKTKIITRRPR